MSRPPADARADLNSQIEHWVRTTYGAEYTSTDVGSLGGHSGVTIGFDVRRKDIVSDRLVLKMPPPGVARKNNFDVLRQVPLLIALQAHDIAAPRARWWSDNETFFGAPFLMMSRLSGASPPDLFRDSAGVGVSNADVMFAQAVSMLAAIHAIDPDRALSAWHAERDADAEIGHWANIFRRAKDPDWLAAGQAVQTLLRQTMPASIPRGLVHGDYYSNNWVFDGENLSGVVDWEGASIGPVLLDLGWLYMMYEPQSWGPSRRASMHWQPEPQQLVAWYAEHTSVGLVDLDWYRALAAYRLASITAYYFEEHRSGRRRNDAWEMFGEAFPYLMGNAQRLLEARDS